MTRTQTFVLIIGILYLIAGIAGFVPALVKPPAGDAQIAMNTGHGLLFGLFPINLINNIVHLAVGALGLIASLSVNGALYFARALAIFFGILTALGLFQQTNTLFGYMPLHGNDVWLNALTTALGAHFGWIARQTVKGTRKGS